jgi:hypothetical protein
LIEGKKEGLEEFPRAPAGIHLTLGLVCISFFFLPFSSVLRDSPSVWLTKQKYNVVFRNPNEAEGETEPTVIKRDEYVFFSFIPNFVFRSCADLII